MCSSGIQAVDTGIAQSPVSTTFEISTDSIFSDTQKEAYKNVYEDSLELTLTSDDYWWRVLAIDEAGNQSEYYLEERK